MAINRFFKPVDYEYTPIPFQELVTLGKYYADERKQAEKDLADYIKKAFDMRRRTPLSSAALEVLAVVAYNQPVTKSFIEQVRGVDCSSVVTTLIEKGLVVRYETTVDGVRRVLYSISEAVQKLDGGSPKIGQGGSPKIGHNNKSIDIKNKKDNIYIELIQHYGFLCFSIHITFFHKCETQKLGGIK